MASASFSCFCSQFNQPAIAMRVALAVRLVGEGRRILFERMTSPELPGSEEAVADITVSTAAITQRMLRKVD